MHAKQSNDTAAVAFFLKALPMKLQDWVREQIAGKLNAEGCDSVTKVFELPAADSSKGADTVFSKDIIMLDGSFSQEVLSYFYNIKKCRSFLLKKNNETGRIHLTLGTTGNGGGVNHSKPNGNNVKIGTRGRYRKLDK